MFNASRIYLLYIIESTSFGTKKRSFYDRIENSEEDEEALFGNDIVYNNKRVMSHCALSPIYYKYKEKELLWDKGNQP